MTNRFTTSGDIAAMSAEGKHELNEEAREVYGHAFRPFCSTKDKPGQRHVEYTQGWVNDKEIVPGMIDFTSVSVSRMQEWRRHKHLTLPMMMCHTTTH